MGTEIREAVAWAKSRKLAASLFIVFTLMLGIMIGSVVSGRTGASKAAVAVSDAKPLAIPSPVQLSTTFAAIAKQVEPAMVNISTISISERRPQRRQTPPPQGRNRNREQFPFGEFFGAPDEGVQASRSLGSGVIVDKRGYILTNNHVVEQATKIQVRLDDDRETYNAKVVGTDPDTDLAVIKIETTKDLPVARLGNSDAVQTGDWVLAFGSPFGLQATVTAGIVSAKDRVNIPGSEQFQRFIQTDAAINPGNSGGPLVSMAGEVVGINTAIFTTSRGYDGVGFALPSNIAINVYNQLIKSGRVVRGSIGVSFGEGRSRNPVALQSLGVPHGMMLEAITEGSPAERAGLRAGDVVTHINGKPVKDGQDLVGPIAETAIGEKVRVTYVRDRKSEDVSVIVEDRTKVFPRDGREEEQPEQEPVAAQMGLRVEPLTPELADRFKMGNARGVVVTEVEPGSFAEDMGFVRRDVITEVNRESVTSPVEFRGAASKLKKGQNVAFRVLRPATPKNLVLVLGGTVQE